MSYKKGGPAFPTMHGAEPADHGVTTFRTTDGMTLWDYYAAAALTGLTASKRCETYSCESIAYEAGLIAESMLEERGRLFEDAP